VPRPTGKRAIPLITVGFMTVPTGCGSLADCPVMRLSAAGSPGHCTAVRAFRLGRSAAGLRAAGKFARVSFDVSANAYMQFMGQYSEPLAARFADLAGVRRAQRVLDVGCGPGALAGELARRVGAGSVCAVEPSASFVAAVQKRLPGVDVRQSAAEQLPFADGAFDVALAQLVVHFMADPVQGLREMRRVIRPGGTVAACVWDHAGGRGPLSVFWSAARELDPAAPGESDLAGVREGQLASLFTQAGLGSTQVTTLTVVVRHACFDDWWQPFTLGVGPAGAYVASLAPDRRAALREQCQRLLPTDAAETAAVAWAATGRA
jgi:SAM-dependent methyltransferase